MRKEFSGTLLGFDDYVSELSLLCPATYEPQISDCLLDMVMEDVTEL